MMAYRNGVFHVDVDPRSKDRQIFCLRIFRRRVLRREDMRKVAGFVIILCQTFGALLKMLCFQSTLGDMVGFQIVVINAMLIPALHSLEQCGVW